MKILMIGNKASGKTTYMTSAYGAMQELTNDFSIRACDKMDHNLFRKQYDALKILGKYPPATLKRSTYELELFYKGNSVQVFEWKDFNGGVVDETITNNATLLANDINDSDGILLFFDGLELKNKSRETRIRRIISLLTHNLRSIEESFFISIIITKSDLTGLKTESDLEELIQPLMPLINILEVNENILYNITPVSCINGKIINTEIPILFILHGGMLVYLTNMQAHIEAEINRINELYDDSGFWDSSISRIFGVETNYDTAEKAKKELIEKAEYYDIVLESLNCLIEYVNNKDVFKGLKNVTNKYYL